MREGLDHYRDRCRQKVNLPATWYMTTAPGVRREWPTRFVIPAGSALRDPGDVLGNDAAERLDRLCRDFRGSDGLLRSGARQDHVRLEHDGVQGNAEVVQLSEQAEQQRRRDVGASLGRMRAVHQHFCLDNRHQARLSADRRVAGEGVRVRAHGPARTGFRR